METLTLFRGIAVADDAGEQVVTTIRERGLLGDEGDWKFVLRDLRPRLEAILDAPAKYRDNDSDAGAEFKMFCACGDVEGATYYACVHNRRSGPVALVVEMQVPVEDCFVDCRDFLCSAFQLWDAKTTEGGAKKRALLSEIFGSAVLRYFDKAASTKHQQDRIALCNAAAHDLAVVRAHYTNRRCIGGRFGTRFHSAFAVRAPQGATRILRVVSADWPWFQLPK